MWHVPFALFQSFDGVLMEPHSRRGADPQNGVNGQDDPQRVEQRNVPVRDEFEHSKTKTDNRTPSRPRRQNGTDPDGQPSVVVWPAQARATGQKTCPKDK